MKSSYSGVKRIFYAALYSWQGIKSSWQSEAAFRQEVGLLCVMSPLALYLAESPTELSLLIGVLLLLIVVELINSAIESVVDRIGEAYHPLSGRAKDQGSAAVLFAFVLVLLVWGSFLYGKFVS